MIKLNLDTQTLQRLKRLTGTACYQFLGFTLDLEKTVIIDNLSQSTNSLSDWAIQMFTVLLSHYSLAKPAVAPGKLIKFKDIPGGYAYEEAFNQRAVQPIAEVFGEKPQELPKAAKLIGGRQLSLGDASTEIPALKGIKLTYILWSSGEFPATASILYDQTASNYLPTEDLAVLGELTTNRLIETNRSKINLNRRL
jgi:hypothetical protein